MVSKLVYFTYLGDDFQPTYMDVSKNRGIPKWMVKIMENPIKMDDLGVLLFLETPIWGLYFPLILTTSRTCRDDLQHSDRGKMSFSPKDPPGGVFSQPI